MVPLWTIAVAVLLQSMVGCVQLRHIPLSWREPFQWSTVVAMGHLLGLDERLKKMLMLENRTEEEKPDWLRLAGAAPFLAALGSVWTTLFLLLLFLPWITLLFLPRITIVVLLMLLTLPFFVAFPTLRLALLPQSGSRKWGDKEWPAGFWEENMTHRHKRRTTIQGLSRLTHGEGQAREISIPTDCNRTVHGVWMQARNPQVEPNSGQSNRRARSPARRGDADGPAAAICVRGNTDVLDDLYEMGRLFLSEGISVLLITLSGYPDPDEPYGVGGTIDNPSSRAARNAESFFQLWRRKAANVPDEASMLSDGEAALEWLQGHRAAVDGSMCPVAVKPERTVVFGHSIGTCLAHVLGAATPNLACVTVEQPLASARRVGVVAALNHIGDFFALFLPRAIVVRMLWAPISLAVWLLARLAFGPSRLPLDRVCADARSPLRGLRGFNNLFAVGAMHPSTAYCALSAEWDDLMAWKFEIEREDERQATYAANFAEELKRASSAREKSLIEQRSAGHGQSVWDYGNNEYLEFLRDIGLSARGNRPF